MIMDVIIVNLFVGPPCIIGVSCVHQYQRKIRQALILTCTIVLLKFVLFLILNYYNNICTTLDIYCICYTYIILVYNTI